MKHEGIFPYAVTYAYILKACALLTTRNKSMIRFGGKICLWLILCWALLLWTCMPRAALFQRQDKCLRGYLLEMLSLGMHRLHAQEGQAEQALYYFEQMQRKGILPSALAYTCIWKACATTGASNKGNTSMMRLRGKGCCKGICMPSVVLLQRHDKCLRDYLIGICTHCRICTKRSSWLCSKLLGIDAVWGHPSKWSNCDMHLQSMCIDWSHWKGQDYAVGVAAKQYCLVGNALMDMYAKCLKQMELEGFTLNATTLVSTLKACSSTGVID